MGKLTLEKYQIKVGSFYNVIENSPTKLKN